MSSPPGDANERADDERRMVERALEAVRSEYTVMPRFGFHQPLDYHLDTLPVQFEAPVYVDGERLPLPPAPDRLGYPADNEEYLRWGRSDRDLLLEAIEERLAPDGPLTILDFGCSSGRVLRHFYDKAIEESWRLLGVDIQARPIQWMREHFPREFEVFTGTTIPHLPLPDDSVDVVYGFSVFTHIKFNWDTWLLELKRILKPGGLLIQTFHSEHAWAYYFLNRDVDWVRDNHSAVMLESEEMPYDYFYFGDASVSQVFWRKEVARQYWLRYFDRVELLPPPAFSFQDWLICTKRRF